MSGTDPTLDVGIYVALLYGTNILLEYWHGTITGNTTSRISVEIPEAQYIIVEYYIGGTEPSFNIRHNIRLIPL